MGSEVFMIRSPLTNNNAMIYGRNSYKSCCKEILYFSAKTEGTILCQNIEISPAPSFAYILNGTCGSNEKNVSISTLFAENKPKSGLSAADLTKLALERADSSENCVNVITQLIDQYNQEEENSWESSPRYSFFACDMNDAYILDIVGKFWAAEKITESFRAFGNSLNVTSKIDKKSEELEEKLKQLGLYDGSSDFNFSGAFSLSVFEKKWPTENPLSGFSAQKMFEILRESARNSDQEIASSFVSVLKDTVSVHWFTGTPNPCESVFKPFIFTSDARISPLTKICDESDETMLRKLHENRKWEQIGDLLQSLEKSCVDEVDGYVDDAPTPELDELLKDCVEAEVKFYR